MDFNLHAVVSLELLVLVAHIRHQKWGTFGSVKLEVAVNVGDCGVFCTLHFDAGTDDGFTCLAVDNSSLDFAGLLFKAHTFLCGGVFSISCICR